MDDFSKKVTEILNHGALNLALGIGYKLKIFDVLESFSKPATVSEIASAARLNRRYLKEWLGIMVTGEIIDLSFNPKGEERYLLPKEHAAFLTRKAGSNNMGVNTQVIPLLTSCAMEGVEKGLKTGEGVPFPCTPISRNSWLSSPMPSTKRYWSRISFPRWTTAGWLTG